MEMRRKAVLFTFLSVTFVSLMLLVFTGVPDIQVYEGEEPTESAFNVFHGFTKDLNDVYVEEVIKAQSTLAVRSMLEYINSTTHLPITDLQLTYRELMLNGSIGNVHQPFMRMNLTDFSDAIEQKSLDLYDIHTNITFYGMHIYQTDPWNAVATANASIYTRKGSMEYNINRTFNVSFSIIGLKDPLYLFNHTINLIETRYTSGGASATTPTWNPYTTEQMIKDRTYIHTNVSPSFLMRLVNDTSNSTCCGIESLINGSFGIMDRSYVDYLFFNNTPFCTISSLTNYTGFTDTVWGAGFKLDPWHEEMYNMSDERWDPANPYCGSY